VGIGAVLFAGCGSRSGLYDDPVSDAAAVGDVGAREDLPGAQDASVADVPAVPDVPVVQDVPTVPDAGACRWVAGMTQRITLTEDYDRTLSAAIPYAGGALVAWDVSNDPAPTANRMVQRVDERGRPVGPSQPVLSRPSSVSHGGLSLAEQDGQLAAVGWDAARGCRFVRLSATGAPLGAEVRVGEGNCNRLSALDGRLGLLETTAGASAATRPVWLTTDGRVQRRGADLVPPGDDPFWTGRRLNGTGDMLFAWMPGGLTPTRVMARVFREDGSPRNEAVVVTELTAPSSRVAAVSVPGGYLLVWTRQVGDVDQQHVLETAPVDTLGRPRGRPAAVAGVRAWRDAGFALIPWANGALMAWVASETGTEGVLRVAPLTAQGDRAGEDIVMLRGPFVRRPAIVPTASGALVFYEGPGETFRRTLYAQPLRCGP